MCDEVNKLVGPVEIRDSSDWAQLSDVNYVEGDVHIYDQPLSYSLSQLVHVSGDLMIDRTTSTDLRNLSQLERVGELTWEGSAWRP